MIHGSKMLKKWFNYLRSIFQLTIVKDTDAAETANIRANKRGEFEFHVISVNKDGIFSKMLHFTNPDIVTTIFDLDNDENHNANTDEEADDDQIDESTFSLNQDTVFELVEPGTFVGMRSPHNATEPFFIAEFINCYRSYF